MTTGIPSPSARSTNRRVSPSTTRRAGKDRRARARHSSGPTPAGSPLVTARTGRDSREPALPASGLVKPVFHVGAVAQLPQPVVEGLVHPPFLQRRPGCRPLALRRHVLGAALDHLDEVRSEERRVGK